MINETLTSIAAFSILAFNTYLGAPPTGLNTPTTPTVKVHTLATHEISLEKRYDNKFVNDVFKDNILLTMAYLRGEKIDPTNPDWKLVEQPFAYNLGLKPGETFAFHTDVLPEFEGKVAKTTGAHFNLQDGFKSDGYLAGDGVCHLATFINWVASDSGLAVKAPTNHDFAIVPEVPQKYGTSIYMNPGEKEQNALQNLYVTNNTGKPIVLAFKYDGEKLKLDIVDVVFN